MRVFHHIFSTTECYFYDIHRMIRRNKTNKLHEISETHMICLIKILKLFIAEGKNLSKLIKFLFVVKVYGFFEEKFSIWCT